MPRRRHRGRKSKFVTKRGLPFQLMKFAETKFIDDTADLNIPSPATFLTNVIELTAIGGGTNQSQRAGNAIQMSGLYISYLMASNDTGNPQFGRVIVYTPRASGSTTLPVDDFLDVVDPDEFKVWYDKISVPAFQAGAGTGVHKVRKSWKPYMKVIYTSSSASSVVQGQVYIMFLSSMNVGVGFEMHSRLYFKDV